VLVPLPIAGKGLRSNWNDCVGNCDGTEQEYGSGRDKPKLRGIGPVQECVLNLTRDSVVDVVPSNINEYNSIRNPQVLHVDGRFSQEDVICVGAKKRERVYAHDVELRLE